VRLRNVTATNTEFQIDEWDYLDGTHGTETIGYVVMEIGSHNLMDWTQIEVGTSQRSNSFGTVTFAKGFSNAPVVVSQAQTCNDASAIVTRQKNVTSTQFRLRVQEEQANDGVHGLETIGFVAWEVASGTNAGLQYEAWVTPNEVSGNWYTLTFSNAFSAPPALIASMQTFDGPDPAGLRYGNMTVSNLSIKVAEEQSADSEMGHTSEVLGHFLIDIGADIWGDPPDADGDGLHNLEEYVYAACPTNTDTDGDTLGDAYEVDTGTSPSEADTDGDGLNDAEEPGLGTDPTEADTDGDGVNDGAEVANGTDPLDADSDDDGMSDFFDPEGTTSNVFIEITIVTNLPSYFDGDFKRGINNYQYATTLDFPMLPDNIASVKTMKITGYIDDACKINNDIYGILWDEDPDSFSDLGITDSITDRRDGTFDIQLYDWTEPIWDPNYVWFYGTGYITCVSILEIEMKEPENQCASDMVADGTIFHSVFKDASVGTCSVECIVVTIPDDSDVQSLLNGKIDWTIDGVQGSTLSWQNGATGVYNGAFDWWYEKAKYAGLPQNNSAFGEKIASYSVSEFGCQGQGKAKIFFARDAKNHPGTGSGTTPNWYYYWSQTGSDYGTHEYLAGSRSYTGYSNGSWRCFIRDSTVSYDVELHNVRNTNDYTYDEGIEHFAFVVRHEEQHRLDFSSSTNWGASDSVASLDLDQDMLRDTIELTFVSGRPYTNTMTATYDDDWGYGSGFNDCEDAALWQQLWPDPEAFDSEDWAKPGEQWGPGWTDP